MTTNVDNTTTTTHNIDTVNNGETTMNAVMHTDIEDTIARATTIQSSAILFDLNISVWTGSKTDKGIMEEVAADKNASTSSGSFMKKLFADNKALNAIVKYAAGCRNWNNKNSLPWSDNGLRLVNMGNLLEHQAQVKGMEQEFTDLVQEFLDDYVQHVNNAAFSLGNMFNRDEYPDRDTVAKKFGFRYVYSPLPDAGDFRVDTMNAGLREIAEHTQNVFADRLNSAMREAWGRLHSSLNHLRDKMTDSDDGNKKRLHATLIPNIEETVSVLRGLNLTGDPELEKAAQDVLALVHRMDLGDLKKDATARADTKRQVEDILNKFNW